MKKIIIAIVVVVILLIGIGGGLLFYLSKSDDKGGKKEAEKVSEVLTFIPLDPFTTNLAGNGPERFVQISLSVAITNPAAEVEIKAKMPLLKDRIFKIITQKTADKLLTPEGKDQLTAEILATIQANISETSGKMVKEILINGLIVQ